MAQKLPEHFEAFKTEFSDVYEAYQKLGEACHEEGPLDEVTRRLVKLGMAVAMGSEGAVHAQVRRALEEGVSEDQLKHVAILAIPSIGFPRAMAALTWIKDLL